MRRLKVPWAVWIVLGTASVVAGAVLALTAGTREMALLGYAMALSFGLYDVLLGLQRAALVIVLFAVGSHLLVAEFIRPPSRSAVQRRLLWLGVAWGVACAVYLAAIAADGQWPGLIDLDFRKPVDLLWLFLVSIFPGIMLRLGLTRGRRYDVGLTWLGLVGAPLTNAPCYLMSPDGCASGHPLGVLAYAWLVFRMLAVVGGTAMCVQIVRLLRDGWPVAAAAVEGDPNG